MIEKILRHLGLWGGPSPKRASRAPPAPNAEPPSWEPDDDMDPMPDYENVFVD